MACISRVAAAALLVLLFAAGARPAASGPEGPAPVTAQAGVGAGTGSLARGIESVLRRGRDRLMARRRTEAVRAIDAGHRVAKVAVHAASARTFPAFERIEHLIREARRALQNGRPEDALARLGEAIGEASSVPAGTVRRPTRLEPYRGATLISLEGRKLGEIDRFHRGAAFGTVGHWQDMFGFLDLGGREVRLQASGLVFGPHDPVGLALVVLADPRVKSVQDVASAPAD